MTPSAWIELIDSYVAGRLSADSFKRRFTEAFQDAVNRRAAVPAGVQDLAFVVEAYAGDPMARGHDVADDEDLMRAARATIASLGGPARSPEPPRMDQAGSIPPTSRDFEAERQRAVKHLGATLAVGCGMAIAYLAIMILQIFAIADQVQSVTGIGAVLSSIGALMLTLMPLIGGVIAYFGATDVWQWSPWAAGLLFIVLPMTTLIVGWLRRADVRVWRQGGRR